MQKLLLILLCLPLVVCASFPIPSVVDTPIIDTLLNINTITPESSDTLQSDKSDNSGWITGQKPEKYSKDWVLGKGEKKSFWRTLWRFHLFQWVWSARILILVMGGISAIFLFLLENGATFSGIPIEWFGLFLILLALSYLFYILEIWPYD
jgi:hypothetical protein